MSNKICRTTSFPMTTKCSVTLNEIFDFDPKPHIAYDGDREELPNIRISLNLFSGVQDLEGLKRELAEVGMEVKAEDDILCVSGYLPRIHYNYDREIRATVARHRRSAKSWSL